VDTVFVKLNVDLKCQWEGLPPDYRIYVDDEMFAERTYQWENPFYLTEILQIESPDNNLHRVHLEPVGPQLAEFKFENPRVEYCEQKTKIKAISDTEFAFRVKPNED
jgi:hypothetical protein